MPHSDSNNTILYLLIAKINEYTYSELMKISWDVWAAFEVNFLKHVIASKYWVMFPHVNHQNFSSLFCSSQ